MIINIVHKGPTSFLEDCSNVFQRKIKKTLADEFALKVNAVLCGEFRIIKANEYILELKYMNTKYASIYRESDLNAHFKEHVQDVILKKVEEFHERDSGWALSAIINSAVNINKFIPQLGSSYIPLPKQIEAKKACGNVKKNDNACFVSDFHPAEIGTNPNRASSSPDYQEIFNLRNIQFPMAVRK